MLSIFEVLNMVPKLNQENLPFYYYCYYDPQNASIIGIWKWQDTCSAAVTYQMGLFQGTNLINEDFENN